MSAREEESPAKAATTAEPSAPAPDAGSSRMEAEQEAEEGAAEAVRWRRMLSLPGDVSGSVRHYHVHEHHYHVWNEHQCCGSERWPAPWQLGQPRHSRHGKRPPCCSGAWAPPWVFGVFPWDKRAGRFSLAGGMIFLVAMALCRGVVWLVRIHRPQPALE